MNDIIKSELEQIILNNRENIINILETSISNKECSYRLYNLMNDTGISELIFNTPNDFFSNFVDEKNITFTDNFDIDIEELICSNDVLNNSERIFLNAKGEIK